MITFRQYLTEARMAPLFHGTHSPDSIIKMGVIEGSTIHEHPSTGKDIYGVSLTRHFVTAKEFGMNGAVLQLNQQKLSQRYKIVPINYFNTNDKDSSTRKTSSNHKYNENEFEEFVIGDIKNINNYIEAIWIIKGARIHKNLVGDPRIRYYEKSDRTVKLIK